MYSKWRLASKYLSYFWKASNGKGHGIHSPFIFHFISKVLNNQKVYPEYDRVEKLRNELLNNQSVLSIEDLGAGSASNQTKQRAIASIAKNAAKTKKYGQLLFRMVKEYQPNTILELGTSLGITTSYLSLAKPEAKLVTLEGACEIAAIAGKNLKSLGLQNITMVDGNFDNILSTVVCGLSSVDFAFIDGNHRREPTERYFNELLPKTHNDSILIFDDIHWSSGMEQAWQTIKDHPSVQCSIDLFFIGIIFFKQEFREKQHFCIRF